MMEAISVKKKNTIEAVKLQGIFLHLGAVYVLVFMITRSRQQKQKNVNDCGKYKTASVCLLLHCSYRYMYGPGVLKTTAISVTVVIKHHKSKHKISVSPSSSG